VEVSDAAEAEDVAAATAAADVDVDVVRDAMRTFGFPLPSLGVL